jgi:pantoate kinase
LTRIGQFSGSITAGVRAGREIKVKVKSKPNVKVNGQECPFHTGKVSGKVKSSGRGHPLYTIAE